MPLHYRRLAVNMAYLSLSMVKRHSCSVLAIPVHQDKGCCVAMTYYVFQSVSCLPIYNIRINKDFIFIFIIKMEIVVISICECLLKPKRFLFKLFSAPLFYFKLVDFRKRGLVGSMNMIPQRHKLT